MIEYPSQSFLFAPPTQETKSISSVKNSNSQNFQGAMLESYESSSKSSSEIELRDSNHTNNEHTFDPLKSIDLEDAQQRSNDSISNSINFVQNETESHLPTDLDKSQPFLDQLNSRNDNIHLNTNSSPEKELFSQSIKPTPNKPPIRLNHHIPHRFSNHSKITHPQNISSKEKSTLNSFKNLNSPQIISPKEESSLKSTPQFNSEETNFLSDKHQANQRSH
jgi:hypothetical protein